MKRIVFSGLLMVVGFTLLPTVAAHASCAARPPLPEVYAGAEVVFTGTVTATEGRDRIATVQVEDVWKGAPLPESVEVRGGPRGENVATSVDRHFQVGTRYLFFPTNRRAPFKDNNCSATRPYRAALERLRDDPPPGAAPAPGPPSAPLPFTGPGSLSIWLLAASGLISAGILVLTGANRRKRN